MPRCTFPLPAPLPGAAPVASMAAKWITPISRRSIALRPRVDGHIQTRVYQAPLLHKEFAQPLNVVMLVKTNLRTQARAHVLLFSSDLTLAAASARGLLQLTVPDRV